MSAHNERSILPEIERAATQLRFRMARLMSVEMGAFPCTPDEQVYAVAEEKRVCEQARLRLRALCREYLEISEVKS